MKGFFVLITGILCYGFVSAGTVDTIQVYSEAMKKNVPCVVIRPSHYKKLKELPVVYLLHGYSGNYAQWLKTAPQLKEAVDAAKVIIVCPDGGFSSWYFDSPIDSTIRYETFVSKELVSYIDSHYKTATSRNFRAISGFSMGGHGALWLAIRHPSVFGLAGSTSGGVDFRPFPDSWEIKKRLGDTACCKENWEQYTVINEVKKLKPGSLQIIIDCGLKDFFLGGNQALHQYLVEQKIKHDYIERPGGHEHKYWNNSIDYHLLYFYNYFTKQKNPIPEGQ